jgi:hypothetical protein
MLQRFFLLAVAIGTAYWYWSGPYQERLNPSYESIVAQNDENMAQCTRADSYKRGATGTGPGAKDSEQQCAEEFNVYQHEGHWHRYDMTRPDEL